MNNNRFKFSLVAAAVIGLLALSPAPAAAQVNYAAQTLGVSRNDGSTATNVAYVIDVRKQKTVGLAVVNAMATSSTAAQGVAYSTSIDGLKWSAITVTNVTPVASAESTTIIPIDCSAIGYIKINYLTNAGAANAFSTNTLSYTVKTGL